MDIKELLAGLSALAKLGEGDLAAADATISVRRSGLVADLPDFITEFREMLEHQQREADTANVELELETVSVIHAIEIGLEETHKAHAVVEAARQDAQQRINEAMARVADEKRSKIAEAVFNTCTQQIATIPEVRALARGEALDGQPLRGNQAEAVLRRLAENIANNVAVYATLSECAKCDGTGTDDSLDEVYEGNCLECNGEG